MHDYDDGWRRGDGRQGVHDNAELAVIGVGIVGVEVSYLSHRKHRQKDKAKPRNQRQKVTAVVALEAEECLKSRQSEISAVSIVQKTAPSWTSGRKSGCLGLLIGGRGVAVEIGREPRC